jgi:hypothetical protein
VTAWCAAGAYLSWVVGPWLNPGIDDLNGYVSEYAARDQPFSSVFRAADVVAGLLAVAAALTLPVRRAVRAAVLGFGLVAAVEGAFSPMDCAPYVDPTCALRERAAALSAAHEWHTVTSVGAAVAVLAGLVLLAAGPPGLVRRAARVLLAVEVLTLAGSMLALLAGQYTGVFERVQLVGVCGWLLLVSLAGPDG